MFIHVELKQVLHHVASLLYSYTVIPAPSSQVPPEKPPHRDSAADPADSAADPADADSAATDAAASADSAAAAATDNAERADAGTEDLDFPSPNIPH